MTTGGRAGGHAASADAVPAARGSDHAREDLTWHHGLVAAWWAEFNRARPEEVAYSTDAVRRFGQPALDLACGTGRILVPLLEAGLDVDGIDLSDDMLAHARHAAAARGMSPTLLRQSMRELEAPRRYRTVIVCDSFGIGGSREHDREALRRVHRSLEPGGALIVSHELPYADAATWSRWLPGGRDGLPEAWPDGGDRDACSDGTSVQLRTRLERLEPAAQRLILGIRARRWRGDELVEQEERRMPIAVYFVPELVEMLRDAGFRSVEVQGWYTGLPAVADDASVILVARA